MLQTSFRQVSFFVAILVFLSGCSTTPDSFTNVEFDLHQQRLASISEYQAFGKIGYISPQQRESLNFQWQHSQDGSELRLTTFLGQTVLKLNLSPSGAEVETYEGDIIKDRDAQVLIYQLTGLMIPIEPLSDWLLGKPSGAKTYVLNDTNTLQSLEKQISGQKWKLNFLSYRDHNHQGFPLPLPSKLRLEHQDTKINIVISKWLYQ
ncbi:lipoprotein insertase outer membrane protein LolB [Vibrio sonorensis]|uniref:lipoprotein insertase outer membrane protein LolB n=1 Tax=Vibrio sonorensis TaxID=1004316 RepID=UPI0008D90C28|nr:lipoprotein insertase outer membrane protein LolB [Vibrio sonorensis]